MSVHTSLPTELERIVQDAFNEMDQTLARLPRPQRIELAVPRTSENEPMMTSSMSWASDLGSDGYGWRERFSDRLSVTPTQEEQEWLDERMAEARAMSTAESDEQEFVEEMMCMHPNLQEDGE